MIIVLVARLPWHQHVILAQLSRVFLFYIFFLLLLFQAVPYVNLRISRAVVWVDGLVDVHFLMETAGNKGGEGVGGWLKASRAEEERTEGLGGRQIITTGKSRWSLNCRWVRPISHTYMVEHLLSYAATTAPARIAAGSPPEFFFLPVFCSIHPGHIVVHISE
jgi:hypothetical protein